MLIIASKELRSFFGSPLAWIIFAIVQLILGWIFLARLDAFLGIQSQLLQLANPPGFTEAVVAPLFTSTAIVLLMAMPLLTMRTIAEERRNETITFLVSSPVSMTQIVIGKFIGLIVFVLAIVCLITVMAAALYAGGTIDAGLLMSNVAGIVLLASAFGALGMYISSLTPHPVVAAVGTLGALLGLWLINLTATDTGGISNALSPLKHFENFNKGLIDTFDIAYFVLFTITFVALTIRRLDGIRLHG